MSADGTPGARPARAAIVAGIAALLSAVALAVPAAATATDAPPAVRAPAAILVQPATGDVVFGRRIGQRRPIASTTKLMTALLALEHLRLDEPVTVVHYTRSPAESTANLPAGERLSAADLLRALLLASANEAAQTLAVRIGGSEPRFIRMMNRRARELGLTDTHYSTPIGLDSAGNYSSARDLVKLTLILRRSPFFRRVTDLTRATLHTSAGPRTIFNRNLVVRQWAPADGIKTGHTARAGYVLVGSASQHGVSLISVVLGDPSEAVRDTDTLSLLRYGLAQYHRVTVLNRGRPVTSVAVKGRGARAELVPGRNERRIVHDGEAVRTHVAGLPDELEGPLPAGARVATVEVSWRGRVVDRVPLVTAAPVPKPSLLSQAGTVARDTLILVAALAAVLGSLRLVVLIRRRNRRRRDAAHGGRVA